MFRFLPSVVLISVRHDKRLNPRPQLDVGLQPRRGLHRPRPLQRQRPERAQTLPQRPHQLIQGFQQLQLSNVQRLIGIRIAAREVIRHRYSLRHGL